MSLPGQSEDCSSLSPGSSWPLAVPRRTSARSRNATADGEVLVTVTVVARSDPAGPACLVVAAVAETREAGSGRRGLRVADWGITARRRARGFAPVHPPGRGGRQATVPSPGGA